MKKITKKLIIIILLTLIISSFYYINTQNYKVHNEIKYTIINHPEYLPKKETAINTSFGFKNLRADLYWLETIQYIGSNALGAEYKRYLFTIIDLVTELNPYFEHPYTIGQLLLPGYNERYENLTKEEQNTNLNQAITLGLKGIKNFCDLEKIELIKNENNLQKIWTDEKYKNPCSEYKIPYYLAYTYYHYKKDPKTASLYYKISSAVENSVSGAKVMAAVMSGKGGDREKAYFMFLNIAEFVENEDKLCLQFSGNLQTIGAGVFINKKIPLTGELIKNISKTRDDVLGIFSEKSETEALSDTKCVNYVNKAIRELNLEYIENANKNYVADKGNPSKNAKELFNKGYINYLPLDFQQYEDYGIIYKYNKETGNYDYGMGSY